MDATKVGLKPGTKINGWAFTHFDGKAYWDKSGAVYTYIQSVVDNNHSNVPSSAAARGALKMATGSRSWRSTHLGMSARRQTGRQAGKQAGRQVSRCG